MRKTAETDLGESWMPRVPSVLVPPIPPPWTPLQFGLLTPSLSLCTFPLFPFLTDATNISCQQRSRFTFLSDAHALIINQDVIDTRTCAGVGDKSKSGNRLSVMTPPSLWKTIPFCLHLHGSSFFTVLFPEKTHGTFANIFKSCEKQDFFLLLVF